MLETTDTNGEIFPVGHYKFMVNKVPTKYKNDNGKVFYEFSFETSIDGELRTYKERVPSWLAGDLIKALGGTETKPKVFEWDRDTVIGKYIEADIVHEEDWKDKSKLWPRLKNIVEGLPF